MKRCISCDYYFNSIDWSCPQCAHTPDNSSGIYAFSPELANANEGFKPSYFKKLAPLESNNFWFRSRSKLIEWALNKYFPNMKNFLEIGCGTGFVLSGIENTFPDIELSGSEIFTSGLNYAKTRLNHSNLFQMDARNIPFKDEYSVIGAFDVLEHITEDETVLKQMYQSVCMGGGIILTVPQHDFLWSQADEHACHVRRYSKKDLIQKVQKAGFKITRTTSFVTFLLPLMYASRLKQKQPNEDYDPMKELKISGLLNSTLEKILGLERILIQKGISFPAGGSLLLIAHKK